MTQEEYFYTGNLLITPVTRSSTMKCKFCNKHPIDWCCLKRYIHSLDGLKHDLKVLLGYILLTISLTMLFKSM